MVFTDWAALPSHLVSRSGVPPNLPHLDPFLPLVLPHESGMSFSADGVELQEPENTSFDAVRARVMHDTTTMTRCRVSDQWHRLPLLG